MNGYENISRQQLENIFTTPSSLKHTIKSAPRPKKHTPTTGSTPAPRPKSLTPALSKVNHLLYLIITHEVHRITINVYLKNIRQYLRDIIDTLKTFGEWKIHLTMKMNFVLTIGFLEYRQMHSKSDNLEIISGFEIDETVEKLSESLVQRCQIAFTNDYCLNCGWSYVDSPGWLKNKKTTKIMKKWWGMQWQLHWTMRVMVQWSFCNNCIEIYELDLAYFLSAIQLIWETCLKTKSRIRIAERCQHANNCIERYQRQNVSCHASVCKSKQQVRERLWFKQLIFISNLLGGEQSLWAGNVTKVAHAWF